MKRISIAVVVLAVAALAAAAWAADKDAKPMEHHAAAGATTSRYMIISPHSASECVNVLGAIEAKNPSALASWQFGCMDGDHTGYCEVKASSAEEALQLVPESIRAKAHAVKLHTFTAAELKELHAKMKS